MADEDIPALIDEDEEMIYSSGVEDEEEGEWKIDDEDDIDDDFLDLDIDVDHQCLFCFGTLNFCDDGKH